MVRSGACYNANCAGGLGFWGANGHDGIWHVSLIGSLAKGSLEMPVFSGQIIQNYHIGFDFLMSLVVRITNINPSTLYFQIIPPILALLIGILAYKFVYGWRKSENEALWSTFFVYFGGSLGWLVSLFRGQGWGGESMFWSQQSISTLINPPFAMSLIFLLLGLIFLHKYLIKKTWLNFLTASFFFGVVIFVKVYAGLLALTALFAVAMWELIRNKNIRFFYGFLISLALSLLLFLPFNKSSTKLISFAPFWFLESMMALSDRVGWQRMYSAMTTYRMGHIWIKAIPAYLTVFAIFIVGNFGLRVLAFAKKIKTWLKIDSIELYLYVLIVAGIIVPTLFVQKGTPWNTIQFFYYSLIFAGVIAGCIIGKYLYAKKNKFILGILIILFTIPTTLASLRNYLPKNPQAILPQSEKEALEFLSSQPKGIVLTYPYDKKLASEAISPRPLYLYESTAYVSAFSGHTTFLEDQINLDIMQYSWITRKTDIEAFLDTLDVQSARKFLKDNNISYIYWIKDQHARIGDKQLDLTKIFDNGNVTIYKVN